MCGRTPILPIDVEFGVALPDISHASKQNYAKKLKAWLKWSHKVAKENNDCEAVRPKKYYNQKFKYMKIVPGDLVLVRVKVFGPDYKLADIWEQVPYRVLKQHNNTLVYKVQPVNNDSDDSIHMLHRNMLFSFQSHHDDVIQEENVALQNANLAMMAYFS